MNHRGKHGRNHEYQDSNYSAPNPESFSVRPIWFCADSFMWTKLLYWLCKGETMLRNAKSTKLKTRLVKLEILWHFRLIGKKNPTTPIPPIESLIANQYSHLWVLPLSIKGGQCLDSQAPTLRNWRSIDQWTNRETCDKLYIVKFKVHSWI